MNCIGKIEISLFTIYYQVTTRRTLKRNITIILDKLDLWKR
jgi:hypothetical protein